MGLRRFGIFIARFVPSINDTFWDIVGVGSIHLPDPSFGERW